MAPMSNLPPLAAAAPECRLSTGQVKILRGPATGTRCSVRIHGDLVLKHLVRQVGGLGRMVHQNPPHTFDQTFFPDDPEAFHRSYVECSNMIHKMLQHTPVLMEFDLADRNWDRMFLPHTIAMILVGNFQQAIERNSGLELDTICDIDVELPVIVTAVYNEPKAGFSKCITQLAGHYRT